MSSTDTASIHNPVSLLTSMFSPDSDRWPLASQLHPAFSPLSLTRIDSRSPAEVSEDGSYKIDADPDVFGVILTWLRRRRLLLKTNTSLESVQVEAEYFGLEELKQHVEGLISAEKSIRLLKGGQGQV